MSDKERKRERGFMKQKEINDLYKIVVDYVNEKELSDRDVMCFFHTGLAITMGESKTMSSMMYDIFLTTKKDGHKAAFEIKFL